MVEDCRVDVQAEEDSISTESDQGLCLLLIIITIIFVTTICISWIILILTLACPYNFCVSLCFLIGDHIGVLSVSADSCPSWPAPLRLDVLAPLGLACHLLSAPSSALAP